MRRVRVRSTDLSAFQYNKDLVPDDRNCNLASLFGTMYFVQLQLIDPDGDRRTTGATLFRGSYRPRVSYLRYGPLFAGPQHAVENGQIYFRLSNGQLLRNDEDGNVVEYNNRFDSIPETEFVVFDFSNPEDGFFQVPYLALPPTIGAEFPYPGASGRSTFIHETPTGSIDGYHFNFGDLAERFAMNFGRGVGPLNSGRFSDSPGGETWVLVHAFVVGTTVIKTATQSPSWGAFKSFFNEGIMR